MTRLVLFSPQMLRLDDHPALAQASDGPIVPLFVLDEDPRNGTGKPLGGASRWWLLQSLKALSADLEALGSRLIVRIGPVEQEVPDVARAVGADAVHITRSYAPDAREGEAALADILSESGIVLRRFAGPLLYEPDHVFTKAGKPYTVFSPFWRMCQSLDQPGQPLASPAALMAPIEWPASVPFEDLDLEPKPVDWAGGLRAAWAPGSKGAKARLEAFLDGPVVEYHKGRDFPGRGATSFLSPHIRFGEISVRRIWEQVKVRDAAGQDKSNQKNYEHFLRELGWREFSYHLLFHFPHITKAPLRSQYQGFQWETHDTAVFKAWTKGQTGFPIVDAGMRQLWQTGYMHNRVRMIVSSFLVKDMLHHWHLGEGWFWDTLVDADPANNVASWQWSAGCGADAAPYFRIFNPSRQSETFDPDGDYIRTYVLELSTMPSKYIHAPHEAPDDVLRAAGVVIGETYPAPLFDRKAARERALAAYSDMRAST